MQKLFGSAAVQLTKSALRIKIAITRLAWRSPTTREARLRIQCQNRERERERERIGFSCACDSPRRDRVASSGALPVSIRSSRCRNTEITATITLGTIKHCRRRSSRYLAHGYPTKTRNPFPLDLLRARPPSRRDSPSPRGWPGLNVSRCYRSRQRLASGRRERSSTSFITIILKRVPSRATDGDGPAWPVRVRE